MKGYELKLSIAAKFDPGSCLWSIRRYSTTPLPEPIQCPGLDPDIDLDAELNRTWYQDWAESRVL